MSVDVVIVNYRSAGDLGRACDSLFETQAHLTHMTLAVVNVAPLERDRQVASDICSFWQRQRRAAVYWEFADNVGYNHACNVAGGAGESDVVLLLNADIEFNRSPVVASLEADLRSRSDWGIAGPRQVDRSGRLTAAGIFGSHARPVHRGWHEPDRGQYVDVRDDVVTVAGSIFALRRDTWRVLTDCPVYQDVAPGATGPMLPTKHFWGETGCAYHAAAHGLRCVYDGTVVARHEAHGAPNSSRWARDNRDRDAALFAEFCDAHGLEHDQKARHQ
jgi:hypothetical protein